jgi:short-subunit dehydrogenase
MTYLILGATSGLGRELAYILAKNSNDLIIISRDERDLRAIKSDLEIKFKITVKYFAVDASSFDEIKKFLYSNLNLLSEIQGILFPVGMMKAKDEILNDMSVSNSLIQANMGVVAYFLSKIFPIFMQKNKGVIVGFGSVTSTIGRDVNTVYAASKRGLESLFESLAIMALPSKLKIQFYTIGYLDTNLSYGKKLLLPKGSTKKLAKIVYKNLNKNYRKIYYPLWWSVIAVIIKILPFSLIRYIYKFL